MTSDSARIEPADGGVPGGSPAPVAAPGGRVVDRREHVRRLVVDYLVRRGKLLWKVATTLVVAGAMLGCYIGVANLAAATPRGPGMHNAELVWRVERWLWLPDEATLQRLVVPAHGVVVFLNHYYAYMHFITAFVFVIAVHVFRRADVGRMWAVLAGSTIAAEGIDAILPVAPPRLLPGSRLSDTLALFGPHVYSTSAGLSDVENQFGSMPSVHFLWSAIVAWGVITFFTRLGFIRWLAVAHPVLTLAAIVLTGNHYWMDAIVAGALLAAAVYISGRWRSWTTARTRLCARWVGLAVAFPVTAYGLAKAAAIMSG